MKASSTFTPHYMKHKKLQGNKHVLMSTCKQKYTKAHVLMYFLHLVPTFTPQWIKVYLAHELTNPLVLERKNTILLIAGVRRGVV